MKFEHTNKNTQYMSDYEVHPGRAALWAAAFEVESLTELGWDVLPAEQAIPVLDAAIARFHSHSEELRPLAVGDPLGLRGNVGVLRNMREWLVKQGGTISLVADDAPDSA